MFTDALIFFQGLLSELALWPATPSTLALIYDLYTMPGCRNSIHKRQARLFTLFAPPLSPADFGARPVDRSAPPGHNKYIHLHGVRRGIMRERARSGAVLVSPIRSVVT